MAPFPSVNSFPSSLASSRHKPTDAETGRMCAQLETHNPCSPFSAQPEVLFSTKHFYWGNPKEKFMLHNCLA